MTPRYVSVAASISQPVRTLIAAFSWGFRICPFLPFPTIRGQTDSLSHTFFTLTRRVMLFDCWHGTSGRVKSAKSNFMGFDAVRSAQVVPSAPATWFHSDSFQRDVRAVFGLLICACCSGRRLHTNEAVTCRAFADEMPTFRFSFRGFQQMLEFPRVGSHLLLFVRRWLTPDPRSSLGSVQEEHSLQNLDKQSAFLPEAGGSERRSSKKGVR